MVNSPECVPTGYTSLAVVDPDPSQYGSGTVAFADGSNSLPAAGELPLDASGTVDLSGLQLNTAAGLPQFSDHLERPGRDTRVR